MVDKVVAEELFREVMKRHFTPSRSISSTEYLRGREPQLRQIDRAFNSEGKHIFVHGDRGVGKTSLGRTAAFVHGSPEGSPPTIECEKGAGPYQLLRDIATACVPPRHLVDAPVQKKSLKAGLSFLGGGVAEEIKRGVIPQITSVNEGLAIVGYLANLNQRAPVIVIDEFDVIEDEKTRHTFASFLKHVSDQEIGVRFIVCGIGDSLDEMIGSHLSTGRYLKPVPLERISHDARWQIIASAADELNISVDANSMIRMGQISDGFPYYVHLMGEKLFWAMHDDPSGGSISTPAHFDIALREASVEAEPSLKVAYEKATQKYNNDYQQVLWAVADDSNLRRQMKDIYGSYTRIMSQYYCEREPLDLTKFYQRMNALRTERHGSILRTPNAGWYEFRENRLRGYVRLMAEREGIQLESEHHLGEKRFNPLLEYQRFNAANSVRG
jgi:Cdc6-like AAA superfamily ATPase